MISPQFSMAMELPQFQPATKSCGICRFVHGVIVCWFASTLVAFSQLATNNTANIASDLAEQLQLRLSEAQAKFGTLQTDTKATTNLPTGATAAEANEYPLIAASLMRTYQDHLEELARWNEAQQRQQELDLQAAAWRGFAEPPPYSILLVDEERDAVQSLTAKITASETSLDVLHALGEDAALALKKSDEQLRQFNEQLESEKEVSRVTRLDWLRELEQLRNRQSSATAALNETRRLKVVADLAGQRQQLAFVQRRLAIASQQVRFSEADLQQVLAKLEVEQLQLQKEITAAENELAGRQQEQTLNRQVQREAVENHGLGQTNETTAMARLAAVAELRRIQVETSQQKLTSLRRLADTVVAERGLWKMRFAAFNSQDLAKIREGYQRLEHLEQLVRIVRPYFLQQFQLVDTLIGEQRNRTAALPEVAAEMVASLQQREELDQRGLRTLETLERLVARWKESLDQQRANLPPLTRVRDLFSEFSTFATKFWHFELFAAVDTITVDGQTVTGRRSVTIGKIALALIILGVGYWLSLLVSRVLERLVVKRLKVESNQASLIRRWVRVLLILGLVIFSMVSVKIPLTIFAFLGGALAIGLGFGTQNLLKNFVSGIIILFERPFRVGDVLDVANHRGTVVSIGIRSSVLKLGDGTETLIPNSSLLENNLTNWTYSDRNVRFALTVGVAYGSDTRKVADLLQEVAGRHGVIQNDPAPKVIFQDFGDNALTFELRYWVDVHHHNASQIGSDLRHMIAGTFAEHGIIMAYPQRDLHLDTVRPLQIQIIPPEKPADR